MSTDDRKAHGGDARFLGFSNYADDSPRTGDLDFADEERSWRPGRDPSQALVLRVPPPSPDFEPVQPHEFARTRDPVGADDFVPADDFVREPRARRGGAPMLAGVALLVALGATGVWFERGRLASSGAADPVAQSAALDVDVAPPVTSAPTAPEPGASQDGAAPAAPPAAGAAMAAETLGRATDTTPPVRGPATRRDPLAAVLAALRTVPPDPPPLRAPAARPLDVPPPAKPAQVATVAPARPEPAPLITPPRAAAAADCEGARTPAARIVCADPTLAAADRRLDRAYKAALEAGAPAEALRSEQDDWLGIREDAARYSPKAVANIYRQRTEELEAMASKPHD